MDPLDREKLEKMLTDFSQELVTFQHRFMGSFPDGVDDLHIREFVIEEHPLLKIVNNEIAKIFAWSIGGAAGVAGFYRAFSMGKKELRKFFRKHPSGASVVRQEQPDSIVPSVWERRNCASSSASII